MHNMFGDETMYIYYEIEDLYKNQLYEVTFYFSEYKSGRRIIPQSYDLSGDVGKGNLIYPVGEKKIAWNLSGQNLLEAGDIYIKANVIAKIKRKKSVRIYNKVIRLEDKLNTPGITERKKRKLQRRIKRKKRRINRRGY